eukprot:6211980-Pleurochrysis_carterae.AAC.4
MEASSARARSLLAGATLPPRRARARPPCAAPRPQAGQLRLHERRAACAPRLRAGVAVAAARGRERRRGALAHLDDRRRPLHGARGLPRPTVQPQGRGDGRCMHKCKHLDVVRRACITRTTFLVV